MDILYLINDVAVPLVNWPVGSYWTNDGKPTDKYGSNSIELDDGSIQCAGFAKYVYKIIWGDYNYGRAVNRRENLKGTIDDFKGINTGARINCDKVSDKKNHSMVIVRKGSDGITVYDANWDNACGVDIHSFTYEKFKETFINIKETSYTP